MSKDTIDWERVVQDPDYRRRVIARLNAQARTEKTPEQAPGSMPQEPASPRL